ncbi:MAG: leucine-rich repeat domain-containing protein [Lachnospiraceae bacterium]|nr:leucine-rich repeat domain-containing protein [Lachnospiraceae bacterium]
MYMAQNNNVKYVNGEFTFDDEAYYSYDSFLYNYKDLPIYTKAYFLNEDGEKEPITDLSKIKCYDYFYDETEGYQLENEIDSVKLEEYNDLIKITSTDAVQGVLVYEDDKDYSNLCVVSFNNVDELYVYATEELNSSDLLGVVDYDGTAKDVYVVVDSSYEGIKEVDISVNQDDGNSSEVTYSEFKVNSESYLSTGIKITLPKGLKRYATVSVGLVLTRMVDDGEGGEEEESSIVYKEFYVNNTVAEDIEPSESTDPSASPAASSEPGASGSPAASASPSASTNPSASPASDGAVTPTNDAVTVKKGDTVTVNGNKYVALNATTAKLAKAKKNVKSLTVPANVKIKGTSLKVTQIGAAAVKGNKKLKKVTIGKNVKNIGKNAFTNCTKLKSIIVKSTVLKKVGAKAFNKVPKSCKAQIKKKFKKKYKTLFKKGKYKGKYKFK